MSADDRLLNPLGFQVTRYRRDQEALADTREPRLPQSAPASEPAE